MFNSYNVSNPQTVNINAVSGTILKNYKDSFILRFHMKSEMATTILDKNPRLKKGNFRDSEYKPVVVLQVMLCGEQEFLAEIMWKEDFDKLYEPQESEEKTCKCCRYNDGEVHAECVVCDKTESEDKA